MTYEEAIKTIKLAVAEVEWNYPMDYAVAFEMAISVLEKYIPKVEYGQWQKHYKSGTTVSDGFVSSCCDMWNERKTSYCPNCGAKMKKGEDEG